MDFENQIQLSDPICLSKRQCKCAKNCLGANIGAHLEDFTFIVKKPLHIKSY